MKKLLVLFFVFLLALSVCGCGTSTTESDIETIYNKSVSLFNKIKDERNDELHAKDAKELSNGNLIFKSLRRNGYIEKLINLRNNSYDKYNSLD